MSTYIIPRRGRPPKSKYRNDNGTPKKHQWYCIVLYPLENVGHEAILQYVRNFCLEYAFVTHDRDVDDEGNIKKPHTHLLFRHIVQCTFEVAQEYYRPFLEDFIDFLQPCTSWQSYALYLPHCTPECFADREHKPLYGLDEITYSKGFRAIYNFMQNQNFVQFGEHEVISKILLAYRCMHMAEVYSVLNTLHIQTTLTAYELTQMLYSNLQLFSKDRQKYEDLADALYEEVTQ